MATIYVLHTAHQDVWLGAEGLRVTGTRAVLWSALQQPVRLSECVSVRYLPRYRLGEERVVGIVWRQQLHM